MGRNRAARVTGPGRHGRRRRTLGERAATLPEYALLVAVFVVPAYMGISYMQAGAKSKMGNVATNVASPRSTTTTVDDGSGGGATTTTAAPTTTTPATTTTTQKPTTTTTTTTTSTTTTTTSPPTTTTIPKAASDPGVATATKTSSKQWSATGSTAVTTSGGKPVSGATVTFQICTRQGSSDSWGCTSYTDKTDSSGNASYTVTKLTKSDTAMRVRVTAVTLDGYDFDVDSSWDSANSPFCSKNC